MNEYLREITGHDFTAKDFRTFIGTVLAVCALLEIGEFQSQTQAKRNVVQAIDTVAKSLRNTRAVCRSSYIHPDVINAYIEGSLLEGVGPNGNRNAADTASSTAALRPQEAMVLRFLEQRLQQAA